MGKQFNIAETFGEALRGVPNSGTGAEQLQYIPYTCLVPNAENGYSMDDIEEMARNISIAGLLQPLRVRPAEDEPDRYRIIAGHRRHAAIGLLIEQGSDRFAQGVACIVDTSEASPAMRELQLLLANADNRKMTSADAAQQAERISDCIRRLEDEGYEFPGRHRDWASKLSGLSRSKLGRLKVISDNLIPPIKKIWSSGHLSEDAAYCIAQADHKYQEMLVQYYGVDRIKDSYKRSLESMIDRYKKVTERHCKPLNTACPHAPAMLDKIFVAASNNGYQPCEYYCCGDCPKLNSCKSVCPEMKGKQIDVKAAAKEKKAREAQERAERDNPYIELGREMWARWDTARKAAGKSVKQCYEAASVYYSKGDDQRAEGYASGAEKVRRDTCLPYHYQKAEGFVYLRRVAQLLHCSTDYLLGLTDELTPGKAAEAELCETAEPELCETAEPTVRWPAWISAEKSLPEAGAMVLVVNNMGTVDSDVRSKVDGEWTYNDSALYWMPLPPAPGEEGAAVAQRDGGSAAVVQQMASAWTPGDVKPDHPCTCAVEVVLGEAGAGIDAETDAILATWRDGNWYWAHGRKRAIDMEVLRWVELPPREVES